MAHICGTDIRTDSRNEKASELCSSEACRFGAAGRNRTHDPLVRSQVLYPAELQPLKH